MTANRRNEHRIVSNVPPSKGLYRKGHLVGERGTKIEKVKELKSKTGKNSQYMQLSLIVGIISLIAQVFVGLINRSKIIINAKVFTLLNIVPRT